MRQEAPGKATILITPNSSTSEVSAFRDLFDSKNVEIKFEFQEISEPIRTQSGKVNLLIHT